jgi:hypothetical protein
MSNMIERVAWSLFASDGNGFFDDATPRQRHVYLIRARDAIEAMREPTEAMCEAADAVECNQPECIWQAMIDAALGKEKEE